MNKEYKKYNMYALLALLKKNVKFKVISNSNYPTIKKGDFVTIKRVEKNSDFEIGDFVLKKEDADLVLHRVIKYMDDIVILKGDANWLYDKPCHISDIIGVGTVLYKKKGKIIYLHCKRIRKLNKKIVSLSKNKICEYLNRNSSIVKLIGKPSRFNLLWRILTIKFRKMIRKELIMETIKGTGASLGVSTGEPLFLENDISVLNKEKKYILIADYLPPTISCLDENIVGIIVEDGGILSHAACIAREYRIPCIVGVEDATSIFKNASLIEIDGEKGEIYVK